MALDGIHLVYNLCFISGIGVMFITNMIGKRIDFIGMEKVIT